jgi:hypothetical protein
MAAQVVELASRDSGTGDAPTANQSAAFDVSGDGRYVLVWSQAGSQIMPAGDTFAEDLFVYDRVNETYERANEAFGGGASNANAQTGSMSRDGRYVAFDSPASNLLSVADGLGFKDVFVRDLVNDTTELASVAHDGGLATGHSGSFTGPAISDDGRFVAFGTGAKDILPPGGQTDGDEDIIVRDMCVSNGVPVPGCTPETGKSLGEEDRVAMAKDLLGKVGDKLALPVDAVVAPELKGDAPTRAVAREAIPADQAMFDVGPRTVEEFAAAIRGARTVLWNGPMGVFETPPFDAGTLGVARALADATAQGATTIVGGGDSAAAIAEAGLESAVTHVSTGGGASLEFLEGKKLPGVEALDDTRT